MAVTNALLIAALLFMYLYQSLATDYLWFLTLTVYLCTFMSRERIQKVSESSLYTLQITYVRYQYQKAKH